MESLRESAPTQPFVVNLQVLTSRRMASETETMPNPWSKTAHGSPMSVRGRALRGSLRWLLHLTSALQPPVAGGACALDATGACMSSPRAVTTLTHRANAAMWGAYIRMLLLSRRDRTSKLVERSREVLNAIARNQLAPKPYRERPCAVFGLPFPGFGFW